VTLKCSLSEENIAVLIGSKPERKEKKKEIKPKNTEVRCS